MKNLSYFLLTKSVGLYINILSFVFPKKAFQLAYVFFSEPRKGKLDINKLPKILEESKTEILQCGDEYIQTYTWKGNETVILLIHGWESNASRWKVLLPHLKKSRSTIIAIDAPAHGMSGGTEFSIPKYAEFIHMAVKKFQPHYLIGHSIGGNCCLYYQSIYQNTKIEKMVILGAPCEFNILLQNYITLLSLNAKISKAFQAHYLSHFKIKIDDFSGEQFASKLNIKGLVAHDINDAVVAFEEGKKIAHTWQGVQFIETIDLGHSMNDENLYKKVSQFLFETESIS